MKVRILPAQRDLIFSPAQFTAMVAGFGSGKTYGGCHGLIKNALQYRAPMAYFAPTYPMIRDIFYPTIEEVAFLYGLDVSIHYQAHEVTLVGPEGKISTIKCRSMDNANRIVGFKVAHAHVDEIDTLPHKKALAVWKKIVARLRWPGGPNTAHITTTPEGFEFVHSRFVEGASDRYRLVRASTFENEINLPDGYIDSLLETYDDRQIAAYLDGEFVNLTSGNVWRNYGAANHARIELQDDEPIHIGMDFNVGKMAAVCHVERDREIFAFDEVALGYDTRDVVDTLRTRYPRDEGRTIIVYPDSSGGNADTGAQKTDLQILEDAGFLVDAPPANPRIMDRVNVLNGLIENAKGERRYFVDPEACPVFDRCLQRQPWGDNGKPDKSGDLDHHPEAAGYYAHRKHSTNRADGRPLRLDFVV